MYLCMLTSGQSFIAGCTDVQACMPAIRVQLHAVRRYVQVDPTEYDPAYVSQQL